VGVDDTGVGAGEVLPGPGAATGATLRQAREAAGLSLADVASRTRVPLRQLESIERGSYAALPSPTYAVGFARAYARAVGADEVQAAAGVRAELASAGPRPPGYEPYVVPDPARLPSRGLMIVSAGAALAVLILAALWFATDLFRRGGAPVSVQVPAATRAVGAAPTPAPAASATTGQVRLAAIGEVWLRLYDADNKTLFLGVMKPGDHVDVPSDARDPKINVGRPDKLAVTVNGSTIPPLGDGSHPIKDVRVSAAALAGRGTAAPAPTATSGSTAATTATAAPERRAETSARPRARSPVSETQRANLDAAAAPPPAATGGSAP
jgi:transcriptional regulator with XRE-family HTH domain